MNEKYKNLASNTVVFAIGNACSKAIQFVLLPLYTAYMTEAAYGVGELLNSLTQLIYPVITLCLYEALFRFALDRDGSPKAIFTTAIVVVCGLAPIAILVGAALEAVFHFEAALLCAVFAATSAFRLCFMNFVRGIGAVKRFAISGILNTIALFFGALFYICYLRLGASGYLANLITADLCTIAFLFLACGIWKYIDFRSLDKPLLIEMLRYSMPLLPNALFWWFTSVFNRYAVLFFCGAATAGLYAAAGKLPSLVNFLSTIFQQAWQISATQEYESEEKESSFYSKTFGAFSLVIMLGSSFLLACVYPLSVLLLRDEFFSAWPLGPGLILAAVITCFTAFFTTFFNAAKDTVPIFKSTVIGAVVNVVSCLLLVFYFGSWGAIIASVVGQGVILCYRAWKSRKIVSLSIDFIGLAVGSLVLIVQTFAQSIMGVAGVPIAAVGFISLLVFYVKRYYSTICLLIRKYRSTVRKNGKQH